MLLFAEPLKSFETMQSHRKNKENSKKRKARTFKRAKDRESGNPSVLKTLWRLQPLCFATAAFLYFATLAFGKARINFQTGQDVLKSLVHKLALPPQKASIFKMFFGTEKNTTARDVTGFCVFFSA